MKTAILTKIALVLAALYLACPGISRAEAPEHDITIGRTIQTDKPTGLVYRHDGFWVTGGVTEGTLRHYSTDGTLLAEYQLPGSVQRYGVAWDGTHWWIGDNNYGSETIYKCELNEAERRLEPVRGYAWPYLGPSGLEWAQGYLWVSDDATDIIYRVSVGDTSFTAIEPWCSTNPEPWDLAWDGTNMWSITGPGGGFDPVHGEREIYKHDAASNIIEIWHYPPADDPAAGSYGGCGTGLAFAGSQLWYCDYDRNQIIEGIRGPGDLKGRIAFVLGPEQKIYVMNADGSSRQQVPLPPLGVAAPYGPQWSRDGLWLTFYGGGGWAHNSQIFIVRPDGSGFRQLTDAGGNFVEADFSPDGTQIVFHQVYGNMYIINTNGAGLIDLGVAGSATRWSPDGRYILYTNWGTFTYDSDLFLYDLTTGQSTQITHHAPGQAFNRADWSPDGKKLAVQGVDQVRAQCDVWTMNADGSNLVNLTPDWTTSQDQYATWSPDGRYIVFQSDITGNMDIWYMRPDGTGRVNITNTPEDEYLPAMGIAAEPPPPPTAYYVDAVNGNDNNNGLSRRTAFATISKGIDSATNRYKVLVYPGVYQEEVDFKGKAITIQGVATKAGIPIIENPGDFAVSFYNGEGPRAILKNFVIRNSFMAVFIAGSSPTIKNLNIVDNKYGIDAYAGSEPDISNCIFWENSDSDLFGCEARYSFVQQDIEPLPLRGLLAYWSFDENSRNIVPDKSGNGHNGTIYGATWTQGIAGTGLCFDGLNDYVDVPDDGGLSLTDAITVSAWIWLDPDWLPEGHGGAGAIVCKHNDVEGRGYALRVLKDRRLRALLEGLNFDSQSKLNLGQWTHIAFTLDPSNGMVSLYINGNKEGRGAIAGGFTSSGCELRIGDQSCYPGGTGTEVFYGVIDEALIYDRALTPREIQQLSRGGLTSNPLFADANNGDYHLLSERGRYWPRPDVWVLDKVTSPCIDGGDPNDDVLDEPMPNGGLINMGAYGGTPYASMSETKWLDGDVNHDGIVNLIDLAMLAENWLRTGIGLELPANYNWLSYNAHHYALTLQYGIWEQAEAEAVAVGGHLVTINNQLENYWAVETINNIYTQGGLHNIAWIGLEYVSGDRSNPNSWRWVNGEPVTYWRPYSYGLDPAGNHMYLEGNSQIDPGGWGNGTAHETDPTKFPRGIIELPW